jgi:5-methylcytosine-specific restriction endonuclease McrA
MAETKICRACQVRKPVTEFYAKGVLVSGKTRYRPDCRACNKAAIAANPIEKERVRQKTAFWRADDPGRGRKSSRDSRNRHIDKRRATQRSDRQDPDKRPRILAGAVASYKRHKTQRLADSKAWDAAHPDWRPAYSKAYWRDNPEIAAKCGAARRARKAGAEGSHTAADIRAIRVQQNDRCANPKCAIDLKGRGSVDHIVALVNHGSNWPTNLQILCKPCNSKKRSRDNDVFLECYVAEHSGDDL